MLLDVDGATIVRHDGGEDVVLLPGWSAAGYLSPRPGPATFADTPLSAEVLRTGRAARLDSYRDALDRCLISCSEPVSNLASVPRSSWTASCGA